MSVLSVVTLPARIGYEAARRSLDLAVGAGRLVGLFGQEEAPPPAAAPKPAAPARQEPPAGAPAPAVNASPATGGRPVTIPQPPPEETEPTLAERVRDAVLDGPDSAILVEADEDTGLVWLEGPARGSDHVLELQRRALRVHGVKRVEHELVVPSA